MLSHELKSPLHGITGLSSSLLDDTEVPLSVKKPLSMMQNCAKRLLDMVSDLEQNCWIFDFFWQLPNGKIPKTEGVLICFNGTIIYRWWIFHCHICFFRRVLVLCCVFFVVPLFSQSSKATLWMRSSPLILFIFCWCYCFEKTMIWCSLLLNGTGS